MIYHSSQTQSRYIYPFQNQMPLHLVQVSKLYKRAFFLKIGLFRDRVESNSVHDFPKNQKLSLASKPRAAFFKTVCLSSKIFHSSALNSES